MNQDLQVANQFEIVITAEQKELVKKTVFPDATDAELQLFFFDCTRRGVHPLDKLIHPTKRNGKYTPITSIDMFRMRAAESGEHLGTDDAVYLGDVGKPDFAASVTVYRHVRSEKCPFTATARWSEYFPGEKQGFMWGKMPHLMLAKCAEALALRKAFPQQLHGLYTPEEMAQAETPAKPIIQQVRPHVGNRTFGGELPQAATTADRYTGEPTEKPAADGPVSEAVTLPTEGTQQGGNTTQAPSAAEYCLQQAESAPASAPLPTFGFGKHKGKAVDDPSIPDDYLAWIEPKIVEMMHDPKQTKWRHEKELLLEAVRSEAMNRGILNIPQ